VGLQILNYVQQHGHTDTQPTTSDGESVDEKKRQDGKKSTLRISEVQWKREMTNIIR
jgi:hypothetical protein